MADAPVEPNRYALSGDGTEISYTTSSISGEPRLNYNDGLVDRSFVAEEIGTEASALGTLVTVTLDVQSDLQTLAATLVVPRINLPSGEEVSFETFVVKVTTLTSIGGPRLVDGALQRYEVVALQGVAQEVDF